MVRYSILGVLAALLTAASVSAQSTARVVDVSTVYDVVRDGQKGMLIQVKWQVNRARDCKVSMAAFFTNSEGRKLVGSPGKYSDPNGQATVQANMTPMYDMTDARTELFMPYSALTLGIPGRYDLRFYLDVAIWNGSNWTNLATSVPYNFTVTQN